MSPRRLSEDEHALWQGVARSVSPLRKRRKSAAAAEDKAVEPVPKSPAKSPVRQTVKPVAAPAASHRPAAPPPLASLPRKLKHRIARGNHPIDGRLDLHGLTQADAHAALLHFLRVRQARGAKLVLVITGKGARSADAHGERGVLKRMVPLWLRLPEFRSFIVGFEHASTAHGGEGALYVTLRRLRGE